MSDSYGTSDMALDSDVYSHKCACTETDIVTSLFSVMKRALQLSFTLGSRCMNFVN